MGALLDMADNSSNGLAMVTNQFEEVHNDLIGTAAEAANSNFQVGNSNRGARPNDRYNNQINASAQSRLPQQYGGTGESTGGSARNF